MPTRTNRIRRRWLWHVVLLAVATCGPARGAPEPAPVARPAVLLVSIDGFRADYLERPAAVHLRRLAAEGVHARWLTPVFPSKDAAIARVDSTVGLLMAGLDARGLAGRVNVIVVSDHGMAALSLDRTIYLRDYIDLADVTVVEKSPVAELVPRAGREAEIYDRLHGANPHLSVYRKADTPARWHYRDDPRIAPIIAVADEGWQISTRARADTVSARAGERGTHGYDPAVPSMRALFIGRGPAFRRGMVVPPFTNVHLYDLMARILDLMPAPNDGNLDSVRAVLQLNR